jgi:hypothetical protein
MWKTFKNIIKGIKTVKRYGSLAVVILDILGYASEKFEAWMLANQPPDEAEKV